MKTFIAVMVAALMAIRAFAADNGGVQFEPGVFNPNAFAIAQRTHDDAGKPDQQKGWLPLDRKIGPRGPALALGDARGHASYTASIEQAVGRSQTVVMELECGGTGAGNGGGGHGDLAPEWKGGVNLPLAPQGFHWALEVDAMGTIASLAMIDEKRNLLNVGNCNFTAKVAGQAAITKTFGLNNGGLNESQTILDGLPGGVHVELYLQGCKFSAGNHGGLIGQPIVGKANLRFKVSANLIPNG
jgi:hypothetical protein